MNDRLSSPTIGGDDGRTPSLAPENQAQRKRTVFATGLPLHSATFKLASRSGPPPMPHPLFFGGLGLFIVGSITNIVLLELLGLVPVIAYFSTYTLLSSRHTVRVHDHELELDERFVSASMVADVTFEAPHVVIHMQPWEGERELRFIPRHTPESAMSAIRHAQSRALTAHQSHAEIGPFRSPPPQVAPPAAPRPVVTVPPWRALHSRDIETPRPPRTHRVELRAHFVAIDAYVISAARIEDVRKDGPCVILRIKDWDDNNEVGFVPDSSIDAVAEIQHARKLARGEGLPVA